MISEDIKDISVVIKQINACNAYMYNKMEIICRRGYAHTLIHKLEESRNSYSRANRYVFSYAIIYSIGFIIYVFSIFSIF